MIIKTDRITSKQPDKIDITVKSSSSIIGHLFSPTWDMVLNHKANVISDQDYIDSYLKLFNSRINYMHGVFVEFLNQPSATLTCYCKGSKFCHRHIASYLIIDYCELYDIPYTYVGELHGKHSASSSQISLFDYGL